MRDDMSPGVADVTGRWVQVLWDRYTSRVESRRKLPPGAIDA